ncbi:MAG: ATP-dependent Clp protease ATP-binding subunit [Candidatus Magasanikbacteria bacterium]
MNNPQKLIDNFSSHLKNAIARAIALANKYHEKQVEPVHLLYALAEEEGSISAEILKKCNLDAHTIRQASERLRRAPYTEGSGSLDQTLPELSPSSRHAMEKALVLAHNEAHTYIGTEHLLHGLLEINHKELTHIFVSKSIARETIEQHLETALNNATRLAHMGEVTDMIEEASEQGMPGMMPPMSGMPMPMRQNKKGASATALFTTDLTAKQEQTRIDPVIGREPEVERIIHILARRTKNNPILVGEPGVGKTAIVEGLAKKIAEGDVPDILKRKKILSLDLTLLIAGTIYRGEFEARLKQIVDECSSNPNCILFIDELHNIIGAGSNQGTMDAANILKPALARGQLRCIGATTYDEYKKYISSDPALERRFQMIDVEEPSIEDTRQILKGIKKYYEQFHKVTIIDSAIDEALRLSERYIHDNFQPDKSIDLLDEACGLVKVKKVASPLEKEKLQLEQRLQEHIEQKEQAIAEERLDVALKIKHTIETLNKKLQKLLAKIKKQKAEPMPPVTKKEIQHVLSAKMHIPLDMLSKNEWDIIGSIGKNLKQHIIGQEHAIDTIVQTLHRSQLSQQTQKKPLASMLFVGPSGVGKTELAKQIAYELYHDDKALIRLDMTEFSESHSVSKILGSPAGYVGYKDRNPFIEKIKRRPYSVVLFDEIDKAHGDVTKLLLQMLDEGHLTDSNGRKVGLKHTIIILTTNLGSEFFKSSGIGFGGTTKKDGRIDERTLSSITSTIKERLGAALVSRIGTVCMFNPLSDKNLEDIVRIHVQHVNKHLAQTQHIDIDVDTNALQTLTKEIIKEKDLGARNIDTRVEETIHELVIEMLNKKTKKKTYTLTHINDAFKLV